MYGCQLTWGFSASQSSFISFKQFSLLLPQKLFQMLKFSHKSPIQIPSSTLFKENCLGENVDGQYLNYFQLPPQLYKCIYTSMYVFFYSLREEVILFLV